MTTPPTTPVQEAAERLRRIAAGEDRIGVYKQAFPEYPWPGQPYLDGKYAEELQTIDNETLADAYLAICPPEEQP